MQRMILKELEEPHDADPTPRVEHEQIIILSEDDFRRARECECQHVVVFRIATIELRIQIRFDALTVPLDTLDQFSNSLRRDVQPRPRRDIAKLSELLRVINKL